MIQKDYRDNDGEARFDILTKNLINYQYTKNYKN